ncbi:MAG: hypothetical protein MJ247_02320 [Alphaproteobacteria bacterium]|nr:hypothetical protein [Alphaproteobacteria bacterium]
MPDNNQYYPFGNPADQIIPDNNPMGDMGNQIPNPNDQMAGQMPGYANPYGQMPAGMPRPMMPGQMPAGMPRPMMPGQMPGGMPRPMMPGQMPGGMPRPMMPGQMPGGMPRPMMPGQMQQAFPQTPYGQQPGAPVQEEQEEVKEEAPQEEVKEEASENVAQTDEAQPDENGIIDDLADLVQEEYVNPYDTNFAATFGLPPAFIRAPLMFTMFAIFMIIGASVGWFFGQMKPTGPEQLPGVIKNTEIPTGRPRCGIAQKGQGCVLYIMNATRREMAARDLFQMASDMTEVPKFQIETHNTMYAPQTIPPGYIALINVPPN